MDLGFKSLAVKALFSAARVANLLPLQWGFSSVWGGWRFGDDPSWRYLGWVWNLKSSSWDPLLTNSPGEIHHHKHLREKQGLMLEKLLCSDIHLVTHVAALHHFKIPSKLLYMTLNSSIRGHLVVPNPSKLIHLVIPFGQKCKKWDLSRFENSRSIFLPIIALHCVSDVIKRGTCCLFGSEAISLNKSR